MSNLKVIIDECGLTTELFKCPFCGLELKRFLSTPPFDRDYEIPTVVKCQLIKPDRGCGKYVRVDFIKKNGHIYAELKEGLD